MKIGDVITIDRPEDGGWRVHVAGVVELIDQGMVYVRPGEVYAYHEDHPTLGRELCADHGFWIEQDCAFLHAGMEVKK